MGFRYEVIVKKECENRKNISSFLMLEDSAAIVIHIDSAEASDYGIKRADINNKSADFAIILRDRIRDEINEWLEHNHLDRVLYAISIEEIEAWILPIYEKRNSDSRSNPKEHLQRVLRRNKSTKKITLNTAGYEEISKVFRKVKNVKKANLLNYNSSLKAFWEEVEGFNFNQ